MYSFLHHTEETPQTQLKKLTPPPSVGRVRVQFQKVRKKYNSTIVQKVRKKYKKYTKSTSGFVAGYVQLVYQCGGKKKRFDGSVGIVRHKAVNGFSRMCAVSQVHRQRHLVLEQRRLGVKKQWEMVFPVGHV